MSSRTVMINSANLFLFFIAPPQRHVPGGSRRNTASEATPWEILDPRPGHELPAARRKRETIQARTGRQKRRISAGFWGPELDAQRLGLRLHLRLELRLVVPGSGGWSV